jgi:sterol 3beta-glucosyltransferase/vancomycin aglycone glucosyltransferase
MRIGIQTWGTEGDVRPCLALAGGLSKAGHDVTLAVTEITNKRFDAFGERMGFRVRHVGHIDVYHERYTDLAGRVFREWNPMKRGDLVIENFLDPVVGEMLEAGKTLCAENDLVVGHFFVYPLKIAARKADRPHAVLFTTPLVPTRHLPPMGLPETFPWMNSLWWRLFDLLLIRSWKPAMDRLYRREGVPPEPSVLFGVWRSRFLTLVSTSPALFPPPPDWKGSVHLCGLLDLAEGESAPEMPEGLERFLDAGPPPVYMTFGSMLADDPEPREITALLVEAAWLAGCRAVVQSNWGEVGEVPLHPDVFPVTRAPHDRVFPGCAAVVHHGGAGTTHAAAAAGCPSVVVEHASDQPLWGAVLHRQGLAPRVLHRRSLSAARLARTVRKVLDAPAMARRARAAAARMAGEDGVARAVSLIERNMRNDA